MEGSESRGIRVVGPYTSSSLTLRALLKSAAGRLGMGAPARRVTGLTPPARAMHVAVAAGRGRTLVVVPTDADVETMTRGLLAGPPGRAARRATSEQAVREVLREAAQPRVSDTGTVQLREEVRYLIATT